MFIVLDSSVTAAWVLPDETSDLADSMLSMVQIDGAVVPYLWWYEVRNILAIAERRRKISPADSLSFLHCLQSLDIRMKELGEGKEVLRLARVHQLSVYSATYLELALREHLPLATLDRSLALAAVRECVPSMDM
jgi:predicted nucleic acid-binding protein